MGSYCARGEREGDKAPICPGLERSSLHISELTYRSADQFPSKTTGPETWEGRACRGFLICSVKVTSVEVSTVSIHSSCCSVDSAVDGAALFPTRHGLDVVDCTWSALCRRVLGFVKPVGVDSYFTAGGAAESA